MSTPGSVPRRLTLHPAVAIVVMTLGYVGMAMPIVVAQVAAARGQVLGLRSLLMASELMLIAPALVALALLRRPLAASLGLQPVSGAGAVVALCAGTALWAASVGLLQVQSLFWPPSEAFLETFRRLHAALQPKGFADAVLSVLAIAIFPAVCEEILFRGVLLPSLARFLRPGLAVLGSAVLFGIIHLDRVDDAPAFTRIPFAIVVGVGLGLLRTRSGSLLPPILAHAVLNTITFTTVLVTGIEAETDTDDPVLGAALLVGGAILTAIALRHARPPLTASGPAPRLAG